MDAFHADVLIFAAVPNHRLGRRIAALLEDPGPGASVGVGSVLLLPEVLGKPLREGATDAVSALATLLARLDLRPVDRTTADLATALASRYALRAADAVRLATAVNVGVDRFLTNNRRDFPQSIAELEVTYP